MVKTDSIKEFLKTLEEKEQIYSYYSEIPNEQGEIEFIQVFVPYLDIDIIEEKYSEELNKLKIVLNPATERKILKKFLKQLRKNRPNLKIGNEIQSLSGDGFAVYLNWTNKTLMLHKYQNGQFKSKTCKKTPYWETDNGIWIAGFSNCNEAKNFCLETNNFLQKHFGVSYSVNEHRACGAYEDCKKEG